MADHKKTESPGIQQPDAFFIGTAGMDLMSNSSQDDSVAGEVKAILPDQKHRDAGKCHTLILSRLDTV